ncbi:MAG: hypothetical protein H6742_10560 [Alphaproteobacteria bacterium]|nr:hypothetical protein [Alphaproteobacteria bacterium]
MSPQRVGPFALLERVSIDAGQELWLAERVAGSRTPRFAALRRALDEPAAARLSHEYAVLSALDDPRVPAVLGHWTGERALVTSWVDGLPLTAAVQAHQRGDIALDAATVLDIAVELAEVLRHAHSRRAPQLRGGEGPVVHGHLSPREVVLDVRGGIHLLGFGRPHAELPPELTPPECLAGAPAGPGADHWALGALLVHLLGGAPLYSGVSDLSVRREGRVDPWITPLARVNPALGRVLERLLAYDPAVRFSDGGQLIRSLSELRRSLRGPADRLGLVERLAELGMSPRSLPEPPPPAPTDLPAPPPSVALPSPRPTPVPDPGDPDAQAVVGGDPTEAPSLSGLTASTPWQPEDGAEPTVPIAAERLPDAEHGDPLGDPDAGDPADDVTMPVGFDPDRTEPIHAIDRAGPGRPPIAHPAGRGRLGLGEIVAIVAVIALVGAAIIAFSLRG